MTDQTQPEASPKFDLFAQVAADAAANGSAEIVADAEKYLRGLQMHGLRFEGAASALLAKVPGLDDVTRARVIDDVYAVGVPCEENDPGALLPELDVDDLFANVPVVAARVREVATLALCVPDMPALAALAYASAACASRVYGLAKNRDGSNWLAFPHLFVAPTVPSGCKKSLVNALMGAKAMVSWQADIRGTWYERAEMDKDERDTATRRRSALVQLAAAGKTLTDPTEPARLRARLNQPRVVVPNPLFAGGSPEQCTRRAQTSGFIFLAPDEGWACLRKFFNGREGQENVDVLLCMYTHSTIGNETINGDERGDSPLFAEVAGAGYLPMQDKVIAASSAEDAALLRRVQDRGVFARMLVALPRQLNVKERRALRESTGTAEYEGRYDTFIRKLLWCQHGDHPLRPSAPKRLVFTPEANAALLAFQAEAEDSAAPGAVGAEFIRREADHVHRLSTILAVLRMGTIDDGQIELEDVERAIRLMTKYLHPHALAVAARTVLDPIADDAAEVLVKLRQLGQCTKRELQQKLGAGWGKSKINGRTSPTSRVDDALAELVEAGRIVVTKDKTIRVVGRSGGVA